MVNEVKAHQMPALVLRENVEVNDIDCASLSDTALRLWLNYFISSCTLYWLLTDNQRHSCLY